MTPNVTNSPHISLVDAASYRRRPPLVGGFKFIMQSLAMFRARPRLHPTPGGWS